MAIKFDSQQRLVAIILASAMVAVLLVSLWWRFNHPSLTINRFGGQRQQAMPAADKNMEAIGALMEKVARNPHDVATLLQLTESLMAVGQWDSAENFALKAMNEGNDENPRAMYLLAVIHHNKGQHESAAELLENLLAKRENPSARYSLAILYIHFLNKPEAGRAQLEKGLSLENAPQGLIDAMQQELGKLPAIEPESETPDGPLPPNNHPADAGAQLPGAHSSTAQPGVVARPLATQAPGAPNQPGVADAPANQQQGSVAMPAPSSQPQPAMPNARERR